MSRIGLREIITGCAVVLLSAVPSLSEAGPDFRVATGRYVGNGAASRPISGLGFSPAFVLISSTTGSASVVSSSAMLPGLSKDLGTPSSVQVGRILSLDSDGFTVGSQPSVNNVGVTYHWQAFKAAPGTFEVGWYLGTGIDRDQVLGFQPDYVMVLAETNEHAMQRFAGTAGDASFEFGSSGAKGGRIKAFYPSGFRLGNHSTVNDLGKIYQFAAWRGFAGGIAAGTYQGTGTAGPRKLTGFLPHSVILKRFGSSGAVTRAASLAGDTTLAIDPGLAFAGGITSLDTLGFSLGTSDATNKSGDTHGYVAFRSQSVTSVSQIRLRTRAGALTTTMTPLDTMFVEATLTETAGFKNIGRIEFEMFLSGHYGIVGNPPFNATCSWARAGIPRWRMDNPVGTTWAIVPSLCTVDTTTNSTGPQIVRLAFVTSRVARASSSGQWSVEVRATTAAATSASRLNGLDVARYTSLVLADTSAQFTAAPAGADSLPLAIPGDGDLEVRVIANDAFDLRAMATDMRGLDNPTDTLFVGPPTPRIRYFVRTGAAGTLDTTFSDLLVNETANETDVPLSYPVAFWIDHPAGQPEQTYLGTLGIQARATGGGNPARTAQIPLRATVATTGLAATSAIGEVNPDTVVVGAAAQPFTAFLMPVIQGFDSGIDDVLIALPAGYSAPSVTAVRVAGGAVPFSDLSGADFVHVRLGALVATGVLIEVDFVSGTPTVARPSGSPFTIRFDDSATPAAAQSSVEGDANGLPDDDSWKVFLMPGPLAQVSISPPSAAVIADSTRQFTASTTDAYGNAVTAPLSWGVFGGVGSIGGGGLFTAVTAGAGQVSAWSGAIADTVPVTVIAQPSIDARSITGPNSATRGQGGISVSMRVENLSADPVLIDSLWLDFTRATRGDANVDFNAVPHSAGFDTIPPVSSAWLSFSVAIADSAAPGNLTIEGGARGTGVGSGLRVTDAVVDSTWTLNVQTAPNLASVATTLAPGTVAQGSSGFSFTIDMTNAGQAGVASGAGSEL
jgi:hypothetical protein